MKSYLKTIISLAVIIVILGSLFLPDIMAQQAINKLNLSKQDMLADFDFLYQFVKDDYVFFDVYTHKTGTDWLSLATEYREQVVNTDSATAFYQIISDWINTLNDPHTIIISPSYFATFSESLQSVLLAYNHNQALQYRFEPLLKPEIQDKYRLWQRIINDKAQATNLKKLVDSKLKTRILAENHLAYLRVDSFFQQLAAEDRPQIMTFLNKIQDYPYLLIDISNNKGGSDSYWQDNLVKPLLSRKITSKRILLMRDSDYTRQYAKTQQRSPIGYPISELPAYLQTSGYDFHKNFAYFYAQTTKLSPEDTVNYNGEIFLITSGSTGSAANNFATFAKNSGWATLIGQPTHGEGTIDAYISLPNSGLILRTDLALVLNNDGSINKEVGTLPNITVSDMHDVLDKINELTAPSDQ